MKPLTQLFGAAILLISSLSGLAKPPMVMIVIDDLGHSYELGKQAIALPGPVHFAILPHSQYGIELAKLAHQQGQEVLLHTPMSTINGRSAGPGELTTAQTQRQFVNTLNHNLNSIPHLNGVNNHMGSLLTQKHEPMNWLMREIKQRQLYFLDSRTSPLTVAEQTAKQFNIPNLKRDVFLDNDRSPQAIQKQFEQLLKLAKQNGHAVAIGHPYPETIAILNEVLPALSLRGYKLEFASNFLNPPNNECLKQNQLHQLINDQCNTSKHPLLATNNQQQEKKSRQ